MHFEIIDKIEDIPISSSQWNSLVSSNSTKSVFLLYEWVISWWKIFGTSHTLTIAFCKDDSGKIIGFSPLMIAKRDKGRRELCFIGDTNADYLDFVIDENKSNLLIPFVNFVFNNLDWDSVCLKNIPSNSPTLKIIQQWQKNSKSYYLSTDVTVCPTIIFDGKIEKILLNKYSSKRPYNYFNRLGTLSFIHINNEKLLAKYLEPFFSQHIVRWNKTKTKSLFLDEKNKDFYTEIAKKLLNSGILFFSALTLNNEPIAFHFGFDYQNIIIWYKPSYNMVYGKHSPGSLMLRYLIKYAAENKKDELDFTIGNEEFKQRYANQTRENYNIYIHKNIYGYYIRILRKKLSIFYKSVRDIFLSQK